MTSYKIVPVEMTDAQYKAVMGQTDTNARSEYRIAINAAPPFTLDNEEIRADFEIHATKCELPLLRYNDDSGGSYHWKETAAAWSTYRAAIAALIARMG